MTTTSKPRRVGGSVRTQSKREEGGGRGGDAAQRFRGIFPSLPTICGRDGALQEAEQRNVVRFCIESGVQGLACLLLAGEFYKFSEEERKQVASWVVDESRRRSRSVPVLVGVSHTGTTPTVELARHAEAIGAAGVIVMPPYHVNFVEEARRSLLRHYGTVASQVGIPVMIQDYATPGSVSLDERDIEVLARRYPSIRYVKVEGEGHLRKVRRIIRATRGSVAVFGGMAGRNLLEEYALGVQGSIPGAEFADILVDVYSSLESGEAKKGRESFARMSHYLDFIAKNFESFVAIEKEVLRIRGVIEDVATREPSIELGSGRRIELEGIVEKMRGMNLR